MTNNTTLHLVIDMRQDLMMGDDTFRLLRDISDGDEPAQEIDGIYVTQDNADDLLDAYINAWENAWLATATAMGHDAITAGGSSPEAHDHIRRNSLAALDYSDTGWSVVDQAWQAVWDACPTVTLSEAVQDKGERMSDHFIMDDAEQLDVSAEEAEALVAAGLAYRPEPDNPHYLTVPWDGSLDACEAFIKSSEDTATDIAASTDDAKALVRHLATAPDAS